jgi:ureidoglycolate hydrolase
MENTVTLMKKHCCKKQIFLPLMGTDYVEFYVGNAKQSAILL